MRVVELPRLPRTGDVSDWLDAGHTVEELQKLLSRTRPIGIRASSAGWIDPSTLPRRQWLYGRDYIRQFVSLTISTGGVGKSSLVIVEALAMVSGRSLLNAPTQRRLRVWYWNGEDPLDELQRRFAAAAKHFQLTEAEVGDRLFLDSGRAMPIVIADEDRRVARLNERAISDLIETIRANSIDVVIIDPFVTTHRVTENDNSAIELVAKTWAHIAEETNCSVMLVHHSRKTGRDGATVDDGRGASALLAAARSARTLNVMTEKEASDAEIDERDRRLYFRADAGKANLAPPAERADWFKLVSVDLENAGDEAGWIEGDKVGVVTRYNYPRVERTVTPSDIRRAQVAIRAGGPYRKDQRAKKQLWVGIPIAAALGVDLTRKANRTWVAGLARLWLQHGLLREVERHDKRSRKDYTYVEVGNAPVDQTGAPKNGSEDKETADGQG